MKMFCKSKSSELVHKNGKAKLLYDKEDILLFVVGFATPIVNLISLIIGSVILDVNYMVNMVGYPDMESIILPYLAIAIQTFFGFAIICRQSWAVLIQLICKIINLLASFCLLLILLKGDPQGDLLKILSLIKTASIFDFFVDNISTTLVLQIVMIVLTSISVSKLFKGYIPGNKIITCKKDQDMFCLTGLLYILGDLILGIIPVIIAVLPHIQYILDLLFKADVFKTENGIDEFIRVIGLYKTEIIISIIYLFIRLFFGIGIIIKKRWAVLTVRIFMIIGFFSNFLIFLLRIGNINSWIDLLPLISVLLYIAYNIVMIVFTSNIARIFEYDVQNYRRRIRDRCQ